MPMFRITLRLAGSADLPQGDLNQGYILQAPLDKNGRLDPAEWRENRDDCTAIYFDAERIGAPGRLIFLGDDWFLLAGPSGSASEFTLSRLNEVHFSPGAYVTIHTRNGPSLVYRVTRCTLHSTAPALLQIKEKIQ
jgi:hypothetical protein